MSKRCSKLSYLFLLFVISFSLLVNVVAEEKDNPYLVGEFRVSRVIDGDTIAVEGLSQSVRLICIDTEESEKGPSAEERTKEISKNFLDYVKKNIKQNPMAKFNTPMGWEATLFAQKWMPAGSTVRIEYDDLDRKVDYYNRILGYVFVKRGDKWVNYNVECVRAGMSPYFDKYGRSKRFEYEFLKAEREARIHRRGIWSPYAMCYPNYDDRLCAWSARAQAIINFEEKYGKQDNAFFILEEDDWARLAKFIGKEVLLFGSIDGTEISASPPILELHHKELMRIALLVPDKSLFDSILNKVDSVEGNFVYFRGILEKGIERGVRKYEYSMKINSADQFFIELPEGGIEKIKLGTTESKTLAVEEKDVIPWQEAGKFLGKEIVVKGKIVRTNNIGTITFLNFDPDYRNTLNLVIFQENYNKFPEPAEKMYLDRTIRARGKISEFRGRLQMVIEDPKQIEIIE